MKRLCIIDLNFNWPPDGGAAVDLHCIAEQYSKQYHTTLLIPRLAKVANLCRQPWPLSKTKFFLRGQVSYQNKPPYEHIAMDLSTQDYHPNKIGKIVQNEVAKLNPDYVFVAGGWYFKPHILEALEVYKPVLRIYAHEMLCIKGDGLLFREGKVCDINYLDGTKNSFQTCRACSSRFLLGYPSPRWIFEYIRSKAYSKDFRDRSLRGFNIASHVLVGNHFIANRLRPYLKTNIVPVPHGIDIKRFKPKQRPQNIETKPFIRFLVTGRVDMEIKGLHIALAACKLLWKERHDFRLVLGSASSVKNHDFLINVPWIPHDSVEQLYEQADILILPSLWPDPFPIVALEAMAMGLPVIGTNVGGIPEEVIDEQTGYIIPPGDIDALMNAMKRLLDHKDILSSMSINATKRIHSHFSIEKVFQAHYRHLFENH